jgi:hypothetical protein
MLRALSSPVGYVRGFSKNMMWNREPKNRGYQDSSQGNYGVTSLCENNGRSYY